MGGYAVLTVQADASGQRTCLCSGNASLRIHREKRQGKLMHHTGSNAVLTVQADASLRIHREQRQGKLMHHTGSNAA